MRKFIRNDYTFIKRLDRIADKYLNLHKEECSLTSRRSVSYFHMYMKIKDSICDIKENMRLNALQKINDGCDVNWKKEYEYIFTK